MNLLASPLVLDPDLEKQLTAAGKHAKRWTEKRNELIRRAHSQGAGPREIGRAVGLSHASVLNIIRGRKR